MNRDDFDPERGHMFSWQTLSSLSAVSQYSLSAVALIILSHTIGAKILRLVDFIPYLEKIFFMGVTNIWLLTENR